MEPAFGTHCFMSIGEGPQIGAVIRNAFAFHVKNWFGDTMNPDLLLQTVQEFFSLLAVRKIDYVLVGGIACCIMWKGETRKISTFS